jgi:ribonuclease P protein component
MAGLSPRQRVRTRAEYEQIYQRGLKTHGRFSTVFVLPTGQPVTRLGIAATRKLGDAVRRNRAKRLVREMFRLTPTEPGFDIVVVPKRELFDADFATLAADYRANLERRLRHLRARG